MLRRFWVPNPRRVPMGEQGRFQLPLEEYSKGSHAIQRAFGQMLGLLGAIALPPHSRPTDPAGCLRTAVLTLKGRGVSRNVSLHTQSLPYVLCSREHLTMVFEWLLGAFSFMQNGPVAEIRVFARSWDSEAVLTLICIPQQDELKTRPNRRHLASSGLHLAAARELLRRHGGHLWLETDHGHARGAHLLFRTGIPATKCKDLPPVGRCGLRSLVSVGS